MMRTLLKSSLLLSLLLPQILIAREVVVTLPGDVEMVFVKVPAGTFLMGSPEGERGNVFDNETQHQVTLTQDYYLAKTEVTQAQWQAVMGTPMRSECGDIAVGDEYPVYCVTWNRIAGAGGFLEKLNELLQADTFRLPTEAEWEHAARANTTTRFSHGDVLECSDECEPCAAHDPHMWWCGNVSPFGPRPVGQKLPNPFGLHDMHGNLWEIVNDRYGDFSTEAVTDPTGPGGTGDIVIRGGGREAWINRSASRIGSAPDDRAQNNEVGFRVAASNLDSSSFQINNGLNDAWFNPATPGQGFLITVFPDRQELFLAWFTYDTERPPEDVQAVLGEPGHRWLTAQGTYSGDTANLTIYVTEGGVFDAAEPPAITDPAGDGTLTLEFADCNSAMATYQISSLGISGEIPLERIVLDNVPRCEGLSGQ
jgi:formylglycine-generating enzyme required for sulfatase activity